MPLSSYEAEMMMAVFTISSARAGELIPCRDLSLLALTPQRALLLIAVLQYRRMRIGPYREFMIAIPVRSAGGLDLPFISALLAEHKPTFSLYLTHIGVTTELARVVGWELLGFPKLIVEVGYDEEAAERACEVTERGCKIFFLAVKRPTWARRTDRRFWIYFLSPFDGCLYRLLFRARMRAGTGVGLASARLELGEHPLGEELRRLGISPYPLAARYAPQFCLVTEIPDQIGPVVGWEDPRYLYRRLRAHARAAVAHERGMK